MPSETLHGKSSEEEDLQKRSTEKAKDKHENNFIVGNILTAEGIQQEVLNNMEVETNHANRSYKDMVMGVEEEDDKVDQEGRIDWHSEEAQHSRKNDEINSIKKVQEKKIINTSKSINLCTKGGINNKEKTISISKKGIEDLFGKNITWNNHPEVKSDLYNLQKRDYGLKSRDFSSQSTNADNPNVSSALDNLHEHEDGYNKLDKPPDTTIGISRRFKFGNDYSKNPIDENVIKGATIEIKETLLAEEMVATCWRTPTVKIPLFDSPAWRTM
ncbi:hypothetical protein RYX36_022444 [Vicia faba]